jgi:WD40 repeat protein
LIHFSIFSSACAALSSIRSRPHTLRGHEHFVKSAAFSPDGSRIVTASSDNTARIWDVATGKEIIVLRGHVQLCSAAFCPDGSRVVIAAFNSAYIWETATGKEITILRGNFSVRSAAFSPDGSRIVTALSDNTAIILDVATGDQTMVLRGHRNWVNPAAFSPDGFHIVTASGAIALRTADSYVSYESYVPFEEDYTARIWDAMSGKEDMVLRGHKDIVASAAFSPDGSRIVTASRATARSRV